MDDVVGIMVTWMESQIQVMQCGNKTCLLFRSGWQEWLFTPGIVLLGSSKIKRTIEMLLRRPNFRLGSWFRRAIAIQAVKKGMKESHKAKDMLSTKFNKS
jgi:hypothetical protein